MGGEAEGGVAGKGEVGVRGQNVSGLRQFFKEESFFAAIGAAEGDEGVGTPKEFQERGGGFLVKTANGGPAEKRRTATMHLFPEATQGGRGIQGGGGEFGTRPVMDRSWLHWCS